MLAKITNERVSRREATLGQGRPSDISTKELGVKMEPAMQRVLGESIADTGKARAETSKWNEIGTLRSRKKSDKAGG